MTTYRTPDVYVEEISIFPPSVAEVETAIPAFIGYTEKAIKNKADDLILKPTKIYSLKEYEQYYGYPEDDAITVTVNALGGGFTVGTFTEPTVNYLMYYSVKMFFDNGGGKCYIISVGTYETSPNIDSAKLGKGLEVLKLEDEPTLIVIPEAVNLTPTDYQALVQAVLNQCNKLMDRFAIFDIYNGDKDLNDTPTGDTKTYLVSNRDYFGNNYLKYGAAYYPFLKTTMNFYVNEGETNVTVTPPAVPATAEATITNGIVTDVKVKNGGSGYIAAPTIKFTGGGGQDAAAEATVANGEVTGVTVKNGGSGYTTAPTITFTGGLAGPDKLDNFKTTLDNFKTSSTALYNFVKSTLKEHFVKLPPSGAVAGVYAATDSNRGVWKAPANVSLANVIEPVIKFDNAKQDDLNIDATTGKSINALRAFAGKGTLVWGARTLAGNDNEWRYVSVRRFFNMVEESVKKSTYWAVFEPNDANTWVKVRGIIENYLTQKWREGALAGATTKDAFFVKCGLGTTMTSQDILEGRINVEIGMAVARPAEFIILKFSHKLQTS